MASTVTPTRPDPFALSAEERSVRDSAREFAQRRAAIMVNLRGRDVEVPRAGRARRDVERFPRERLRFLEAPLLAPDFG